MHGAVKARISTPPAPPIPCAIARMVSFAEKALDALAADDAVKGIVLEGKGKAFVAGADIGELARMDALTGVEVSRAGQQVFLQIEEAELEEIGEAQRLFQRLVVELQGINGIFEVIEIIGVRGPGQAAVQQPPHTDC